MPVPEGRAATKQISWRLGIGQSYFDPLRIFGSILFNPTSDEYSHLFAIDISTKSQKDK